MLRDDGRAEDVTQEAFLSALRRMRETDGEIAFEPWIYRIARNAAIDSHRRSSRAEEVSMDAEAGLAPVRSARASIEGARRIGRWSPRSGSTICAAPSTSCSDVQARVLVMREVEGRSYREIGERLDMTRPAVEQHAVRRPRSASRASTSSFREGRRCAAHAHDDRAARRGRRRRAATRAGSPATRGAAASAGASRASSGVEPLAHAERVR